MEAFVTAQDEPPTLKGVVDYINENQRWLGKYKSKTDRLVYFELINKLFEFILKFGSIFPLYLNDPINAVKNQYGITVKLRSSENNSNRSFARLSCMPSEEMWFANISTYGDMGPFLCITSLVALILYFVTSSDSG